VASHELRTPLTVLKARVEMALRGAHDGERAHLEPVARQVERLSRLTLQLLDASRLQAGTLPLDRSRLQLDDVVRRVAEPLVAASPEHRLQLRLEQVDGEFDELRLEQVLQNLVGNALKYSPHGGPVEITVRPVDGDAEIAVADRGIGVTASQARFARFSRGDVKGIAGLGIGLHVSEEIVRRHGGSLRLAPREGGGAVAVVRLPRFTTH
jgi:signal transduction histidine kinase